MKHAVLAAGCLLAAPLLFAADAEPTQNFEDLVVTGNRIETQAFRLADAIEVIDREAILASQAASLAELLASRGGIEALDFYGDGSRASFGLRGFGENAASNTLILLDGQVLNNPDIGSPDLGRLRLEDIERIEILDGGSALWGNQAVGGVIHIITRQNLSTGLSLEGGSYDWQDARARAVYRQGGLSLQLSGNHRESDNYRDNNALERQSARIDSRYEGEQAGVWLSADYTDEFLQTPGGLYQAEMDADRRQSVSDFDGDFSELRTLNLSGGLYTAIQQNWQFELRSSYYESDGRFKLSFRGFPSEPASQDRELISLNPQWSYRGQWNGQSLHVALGADLRRADYRLVSQFGEQRNEQEQRDVFLTTLLPLARRVDLSASVRHSRIEDDIADPGDFAVLPEGETFSHEETLGSVGLNWRALDNLSLFAGWDQLLRYPKVDEYFGSGFTPDTIGLKPQTGDQYELGIKLKGEKWQGRLVAFRLALEDEIVYDPASFSNTNLDRSRRVGATLSGDLQLHKDWRLELSASRLRARLDSPQRIPLVAESHGQLSLLWAISPSLNARAQIQAAGDRLAGGDTDDSAAHLPGYAVMNLGLRWQQAAWSAGLQIGNLLDKEYAAIGFEDFSGNVAYYPLPERNARLNLQYDFR